MATPRQVGIGAAVVALLAVFGSCGHDDPQPVIQTPPAATWTTPDAPLPETNEAAPDRLTTDYGSDTGRLDEADEPDLEQAVPNVPHVKRDSRGHCRDSHGRFTRCP